MPIDTTVRTARTHAEMTAHERRRIREDVMVCFACANEEDPRWRASRDRLHALLTLQGVDSHRGDISDVLNELDAAATWPVALVAYKALFSHMPALFMDDEEAAAYDEERQR